VIDAVLSIYRSIPDLFARNMPLALVTGAGIGGLAAGIALRQAGWEVRILERSPVPRTIGFGLMLAPNAVAALRELGVEQTVRASAIVPGRAEIRRPDGRVLRRIDVRRFASADRMLAVTLRPPLHDALLNAAGTDRVSAGAEVVGFTASDAVVSVRLADGRTAHGDLLIGADGVGSVVRRFLHPNEPPPRRSGYLAIRGVAHGAGDALGDLDAVSYLGGGLECATVRAGAGAIYWYVALLAEDLPADLRQPRAALEHLTSAFDPSFRAITEASRPDDIRLDELFDRDPGGAWGTGPVTLLGDAAHPMLPHTGQGAAQALEDSVALGLALSGGGSVDAALRRYEQVRGKRTAALVRRGRRIARVTTTHRRFVEAVRDGAIRLMPDWVLLASFALGGRADPHRRLRIFE
jgi:2-polyprenyl-6-methoxyphenol hydroxylase-like FAD-dependent oxidoreductase